MIIRRLSRDEWGKLDPIFKQEFNENPPLPENSAVIVAEDGDQVVGFLVLQQILHLEPLWVKPSHKHRYIVPRLIDGMNRMFPNVPYCFAHTKNKKVARLAERLGMEKLDWTTFRWIRKDVNNG